MRKRILVVDDSRTALLVERALLARTYEVLTAADGLQAVEVAFREHPDLILMDVLMPNLGGFDAVRLLRARPETGQVPIIMVSSRSEQESLETGYRCGCNDWVTKPIHAAELLAKVKNLLGE